MMRVSGLSFSTVLMFSCCCFSLLAVRGAVVCNEMKFITRINLTTELKSEVLLPCLFDPLEFNLSTDSGVVWSHSIRTVGTKAAIVDISLNDQQSFWSNRNGRIKAFRDAPASGNFSILIADVQSSDLGLYQCELYRKTNCVLAYKEINILQSGSGLSLAEFSWFSIWWLIIAAAGGGFLLLCLIAVCVYCTRTKRQTANGSSDHEPQNYHNSNEEAVELTYASVAHIKSHSCDNRKVVLGQTSDEVNYASVTYKSHSQDSEVLTSKTPVNDSESEPVIYASVQQKDRR